MTTLRSTSNQFRRLAKRRSELFGATALLLLSLAASPSWAQGLQPGEAYATRFSGVAQGADGRPSIDMQGTVGNILDLRSPRQPAEGQHWINEPQRAPVTAAQIGQVFGVAFDDASPPNIYVTATAAFGLHRTADNASWMPGMFGEGGPGAIYRLDATNGYQPQLFATITLNGRPNSGAALGNIAFDRWNKQFLVSDLETGMIHRIGLDGRDLGSFDHGTEGRTSFVDAQSGQQQSLQPVAFNAGSQARIANCGGNFDTTPACWNVAASNRRVWGLGVWRGPAGETRLYYSVASSPDLGNAAWNSLPEDEKRNALWSVQLGPDGSFDLTSVRREFILPDFFENPQDVARAGYSRPVSDITFPACSGRAVMLVAERGGLRNLGLGQENAFATPHESRTIRYELDQSGTWRVMGRYDIGMYDRSNEGAPAINANCAGGASFGPGYSPDGRATGPADAFVWMSGDKLCSPDGPCNVPGGQPMVRQVSTAGGAAGYQPDDSEVHGVQGQPEDMYNALLPQAAGNESQEALPSRIGPDQAYMVDLDINVDAAGQVIPQEAARNDATMIGDISVYQLCPVESAAYSYAYPLMAVPVGFIHGRGVSHWRWHSHNRWRSHDRRWSDGHYRWVSEGHDRRLSPSHRRDLSPTHWRSLSPIHWRRMSPTHRRDLSPTHKRHMSPVHQRPLSPPTHKRGLSPTHSSVLSPGHNRPLSPPQHTRSTSPGEQVPRSNIQHLRVLSVSQTPKGNPPTHRRGLSPGLHKAALSIGSTGGMGGGGMGGMGGGGMGGMGGGGMGSMGSGGMTKGMGMSTSFRVGPQHFRGGNGPRRR